MTPTPDLLSTVITSAPNFIFAAVGMLALYKALMQAMRDNARLVDAILRRENCDDGAPVIYRSAKPINPPATFSDN